MGIYQILVRECPIGSNHMVRTCFLPGSSNWRMPVRMVVGWLTPARTRRFAYVEKETSTSLREARHPVFLGHMTLISHRLSIWEHGS